MTNKQALSQIRATYARYRDSENKRKAWSGDNRGNRAILHERHVVVAQLLDQFMPRPCPGFRVLDIGCGNADVLASFSQFGLESDMLFGMDLLPERLRDARKTHDQLSLLCADATQLPYASATFHLVILFTVFSSILSDGFAHDIAREADRVLTPGGAALIYDLRYRNPFNNAIRPIPVRSLASFFPGYRWDSRSLTLLPPLARRLGSLTTSLYPVLASLSFLRSHRCTLMQKPMHGATTALDDHALTPV